MALAKRYAPNRAHSRIEQHSILDRPMTGSSVSVSTLFFFQEIDVKTDKTTGDDHGARRIVMS